VLPSLVVTVGKRTYRPGPHKSVVDLLSLLLPPPGERPWYADSVARQQFWVLLLAHVGGKTAPLLLEWVQNPLSVAGGAADVQQMLRRIADALQAAVVQLVQPPLRAQLEAAAPALVPCADAVADSLRAQQSSSSSSIARRAEPLELLLSLVQQLDPRAPGLRLPGCCNPACTSVAGASEADMKLKVCTGCRTVRWAGWLGVACCLLCRLMCGVSAR
jgi:hypothetical protein